APCDAEAQALEAGLAGGFDDTADDVGAEGAIPAADRDTLAAPAVADVGRGLGERNQRGLGHGAGDGHVGGVTDVLLGEDGEVVEVELRVFLGRSGAAEPGGQALAALADADAEAATRAVEGRRGTGAPVAVGLAEGGQLAVV